MEANSEKKKIAILKRIVVVAGRKQGIAAAA